MSSGPGFLGCFVRALLPHVSGLTPQNVLSATFAVAYDSLPCPLCRMPTTGAACLANHVEERLGVRHKQSSIEHHQSSFEHQLQHQLRSLYHQVPSTVPWHLGARVRLQGGGESSYGGAGGWDRRGCATWAPRSATRQGEEQHRHTERGSHTRRDKGGHSRQGGGAQQGGRGNWNSGNREPKWSGWQSVHMGGSDNKGDGLASQPRRYRVPGQPLLNRHQVGGVSRSPDGLFAQQEWEPIRGGPTVRGKRTYGGRPGQRVEEQGTWAAQKHSEAGDGRPVDRGVWTANTVKRPRQQPAHPQYANYWAPLTRKRHTTPHSAQSQHANYWAPRTRKRHQQEHRPQRPTESSDPTQHAKGRTGDRPGPRKGATTRRNVTQGGVRPGTISPGENFATLEIPKAQSARCPNDCTKHTNHAQGRDTKLATHCHNMVRNGHRLPGDSVACTMGQRELTMKYHYLLHSQAHKQPLSPRCCT